MPTYFHVARTGGLRSGQVIELDHYKKSFENDNDKRKIFLSQLFPDGLTKHGWQYLLSIREKLSYEDPQGLIEIMAEFIRRDKYPHCPSRLQSFFAWHSKVDALRFSQQYKVCLPDGTILTNVLWEIEASESFFESDMHLLTCGRYWLDFMVTLDNYWKQAYTPDPLIEVLLKPPITIVRPIQMPNPDDPEFLVG
jgi:hypothetical protein